MPVYVVSHDLTRPGQNYPELWDALKGLSGQRVLLSSWVVTARGPADALRDYLWNAGGLDSSDRLLVMARDSGDWAARNLKTKLSDY